MTRHYYNEYDPFAAEWIQNLIRMGQVPAGDVDTRSIKEVQPDDLIGYTQCHFFAGIAGWGLAARIAGFPADRELWTGSCPCQPFSNAGQGGGTDDPRHLWPDFFRLIRARRPALVMGEQVASALGRAWFDGVASDLEGEDYACRAVDIPACAVDAPHIRSRLYWIAVADAGCVAGRPGPGQSRDGTERADVHGAGAMAHPDGTGPAAHGRDAGEIGRVSETQREPEHDAALPRGGHGAAIDSVAHPDRGGRAGWPEDPERGAERRASAEWADDPEHTPSLGRGEGRPEHELRSGRGAPADADARGSGQPPSEREELFGAGRRGEGRAVEQPDEAPAGDLADGSGQGRVSPALGGVRGEAQGQWTWDGEPERPSGVHGFWSDHVWLVCHDGKARRTIPGLPLLVDGVSGRVALGDALPGRVSEEEAQHLIGRVGAWRGFGNAIVPQLAAEVIGAFLDAEAEEQDFFA